MPVDPRDPTLAPAFARASRTRVSPATIASWNQELSREPRMLVPVDLQALVVPQGRPLECVRVALRPGEDPANGFPPPLGDPFEREPGVYLHWALPDGLTRGRAGDDGALQLPALPNRWLVLRIESGRRRRVTGWTVESERGTAHPLQDWKERPKDQQSQQSELRPDQLTASVSGDPAGAAVWESAQNRFAFHDDLRGSVATERPLTYLVVGWYSIDELDPLHRVAGDPPFDELMRRLGWSIDKRRYEQVRAEMEQRATAIAEGYGAATPPPEVAGVDTRLEWQERRIQVPATEVTPILLQQADAVELKVEPWAPHRSLYHGVVYGVQAGSDQPDPKPKPEEVVVAIGATGAESLARLIAEGAADGADGAPELERLLTAFSYDLLETLDQPDGITRLEEEMHQRAFVASPGGFRTEQVRVGDPMHERAEAARRQRKDLQGRGRRRVTKVRLEFSAGRYDEVADELAARTRPETLDPEPEPPVIEEVRRAQPRFFHPQDPVLAIRGLKRSLRHGYDGRFEPDDRVACRLSSEPVRAYAGLVQGAQLLETRLDNGSIPLEAEELLYEALLEDPYAVDDIAAEAADVSGHSRDAVHRRLRAERQLLLRSQFPESEAPRLTAASLKDGVEASPIAMTVWQQPWVPMYVEWALELTLDESLDPARWKLGELDYEPSGEPAGATRTVRGRSLLNAAGPRTLADQVDRLLELEDALEAAGQGGDIDEETEALLRRSAQDARYGDVLNAALEELRERLLGFESRIGEVVPLGTEQPPPPRPTTAPQLLRAGAARLTRLRVVDAFGRFLELPEERLAALLPSEALGPPAEQGWEPGLLYLPPRVLAPSRLLLRLLDAGDDTQEATVDQASGSRTPCAGWLLRDNVDAALEFFDPRGAAVGQLRHESIGGGVTWEGAPGDPQPLGTAPSESAGNPHLAALATGLVRRAALERERSGASAHESPLAALLHVIDTTQWTVDPSGTIGSEHLSVLVGRPIAVVRAQLRLEVQEEPDDAGLPAALRQQRRQAFEALRAQPFEVRLGALTRFSDGLLGYFVDDDYARFHPVHPSVLAEALPLGPHRGYQGPAAGAAPDVTQREQVLAPYVHPDPTVSVRPGQTVWLTLLMDPGASVHVTSGILPRKSIALLREWTERPLDRIAPSFRVGPILLPAETAGLPRAAALPQEQLWSYRSTPTTWQDRQVMPATQEAILPERPPMAQEGYLRAKPETDGTVSG